MKHLTYQRKKQNTLKRPVKNINECLIVERNDTKKPILNNKPQKEENKFKILSKEYLDMVQSYRQKFKKKKLIRLSYEN